MKLTPRKPLALCQILSGRKNLGVGHCKRVVIEKSRWRLSEHRAEVHISTPDANALERLLVKGVPITLKIKLKYPAPMESVAYKVKCLISGLTFSAAADSADLDLIFDGPLLSTTAARLN